MRRKRIAAWLLCAVLALGLLPATVWAAPPEGRPEVEQIKGFAGQDIVKIVCLDDESHNKVYGMRGDCIGWGGWIAEPHKRTMSFDGYSYFRYYLEDFPDNHHVRMDGPRYVDINFTWSEEEQLWVPDEPVTLPITFYVEEVPDIYEGDAYLSLLDEKPVRFVPAAGSASHETVYCQGTPSYRRYSNTYRVLSFQAERYLDQLNAACGGKHELVGDTTGKINLNYDKTEKKWKADRSWVEFSFTCNRAELPTLERLDALLGNVTVRCADGCTARTCRMQDSTAYYAEFTGDNTCRVTVYHAAFVRQFCESGAGRQHIFAPGQSDRTELTLTRDAATGEWTLDSASQTALPLAVQASCRQPAAPTEKELDRMGGAVIVRYAEVMQSLGFQYRLEPGTYGFEDPDANGSRSAVAASDDLTYWEYRIWLDNTWPYRESYNEDILPHIENGNADAYHALISIQPRISLVYDNGWRVATPLSRDNWDGRAYIMLTQSYSDPLDLNGDGTVSVSDLACLYNWLTVGENDGQLDAAVLQDKADLNHDGAADVYDLQLLYEKLSQ